MILAHHTLDRVVITSSNFRFKEIKQVKRLEYKVKVDLSFGFLRSIDFIAQREDKLEHMVLEVSINLNLERACKGE